MPNTYGRQVVIPMTNKSGGSVAAGDVVIVDTSNNDAFTTTTTAGFTGSVGVAQAAIANNAVGLVLLSGYAALVNVNASVTRGNFGKTHTVAKQATDAGASRGVGTFCQFLIGGTTPDAVVYPVDLLGSSLTNPMTTANDIIVGGASGTPTRLATANSKALVTDGSGVISWGSAGALVLLEAHTASSSATLDFTSFISSTYDDYLIEIVGILPATNNADLQVEIGTGGGPTYDTTGSHYSSQMAAITNAGGAVGPIVQNPGLPIIAYHASNTVDWGGIQITLRLQLPQSTTQRRNFTGHGQYVGDPGGGLVVVAAYGIMAQYQTLGTALTAIRFLFSSGNIASGTIRIYGIAK